MLELFAQVNRNQGGFPNGPGAGPPAAFLAGILGFYCVLFVLAIATFIAHIVLFIRMSGVLSEVSQHNRKMEPGLVWLNLVPMLSTVWIILSVLWISDSLKAEYDEREMLGDSDFGKTMGIVFYVTTLVCFPIGLLVLFMYRTKLGGYLEELQQSAKPSHRRERDDYE